MTDKESNFIDSELKKIFERKSDTTDAPRNKGGKTKPKKHGENKTNKKTHKARRPNSIKREHNTANIRECQKKFARKGKNFLASSSSSSTSSSDSSDENYDKDRVWTWHKRVRTTGGPYSLEQIRHLRKSGQFSDKDTLYSLTREGPFSSLDKLAELVPKMPLRKEDGKVPIKRAGGGNDTPPQKCIYYILNGRYYGPSSVKSIRKWMENGMLHSAGFTLHEGGPPESYDEVMKNYARWKKQGSKPPCRNVSTPAPVYVHVPVPVYVPVPVPDRDGRNTSGLQATQQLQGLKGYPRDDSFKYKQAKEHLEALEQDQKKADVESKEWTERIKSLREELKKKKRALVPLEERVAKLKQEKKSLIDGFKEKTPGRSTGDMRATSRGRRDGGDRRGGGGGDRAFFRALASGK